MCVNASMLYMGTMYMPGAYGDQKALDLLELELQAFVSSLVWVLGTEPNCLEEDQSHLTPDPSIQS